MCRYRVFWIVGILNSVFGEVLSNTNTCMVFLSNPFLHSVSFSHFPSIPPLSKLTLIPLLPSTPTPLHSITRSHQNPNILSSGFPIFQTFVPFLCKKKPLPSFIVFRWLLQVVGLFFACSQMQSGRIAHVSLRERCGI